MLYFSYQSSPCYIRINHFVFLSIISTINPIFLLLKSNPIFSCSGVANAGIPFTSRTTYSSFSLSYIISTPAISEPQDFAALLEISIISSFDSRRKILPPQGTLVRQSVSLPLRQ